MPDLFAADKAKESKAIEKRQVLEDITIFVQTNNINLHDQCMKNINNIIADYLSNPESYYPEWLVERQLLSKQASPINNKNSISTLEKNMTTYLEKSRKMSVLGIRIAVTLGATSRIMLPLLLNKKLFS